MKWKILKKDLLRNKYIYLMVMPVIVYYVLFHYVPMYGAIISFKHYIPAKGIFHSPWVGLLHFKDFFNSYYFLRILRNTISISFFTLLFGFPAPIVLALLLNEVKIGFFKRTVQSLVYIPHFLSLVVVCGLIVEFVSMDGVINDVLSFLGLKRISMLQKTNLFIPIYVTSSIWQEVGWGTIIYLAALSAIDPCLYEVAMIDGAGRFKRLLHVTLPGIKSTIIILLIIKIGTLMTVGHEKIILLYNPLIYETADVITTFVYRKGLQDFNWSYGTAVGLFNSTINFIMLLIANTLSRIYNKTSLW